MTGACWAELLDMDESVESWLAFVERFDFGFEGSESYLLGDARPPPATEDERGGRPGPPKDGLSPLEGSLWLAERACCASSTSLELPTLACRGLPPPLSEPSLPVRCRNRCCFFFRPWRRLIMMSRMRGRKLSRLAWDASWLRVSSSMPRNSSGTFPRSFVSTPMALKARDAMLNS